MPGKEGVLVEEYEQSVISKRKILFHQNGRPYQLREDDGGSSRTIFPWRWTFFTALFLPAGYPHSVSSDYAAYQCWDTIQALASSLTGALATEAVLAGAGVGDSSRTALAATLAWLARDGVGMVGRILFSWACARRLDADCKRWRLVADLLNDIAFFVDLCAPYARPSVFWMLACGSSALRCVVGVAGGATRAVVVQHQARRNNFGDVASKDGSQETLVNVIALIISLVGLPLVSGKSWLIWTLFALLTTLHLYANYRFVFFYQRLHKAPSVCRAVRSLHFDVFNRRTLAFCVREWCQTGSFPTVAQANQRERIFGEETGDRRLGCSYDALVRAANRESTVWRLVSVERSVKRHQEFHKLERVHCVYDRSRDRAWVALESNADRLEAAVLTELVAQGQKADTRNVERLLAAASSAGWNVTKQHLDVDEYTFRYKDN